MFSRLFAFVVAKHCVKNAVGESRKIEGPHCARQL
jgi:hypothetical protein